MALPFLPEGEILTEFQRLQRQAVPDLSRVRRVCQQYLDQQRDMEPCRLDSLQTSSTNEQRPRRLAPRDQPSSGWQVTTPTLRPDQAATPGGPADSYPDPFDIREKTTKDPAPQIQRPAGKNLRSLGAIWQQREVRQTATESLFFPERSCLKSSRHHNHHKQKAPLGATK